MASSSCSNFQDTQHSLASSLNMEYLDELAEIVVADSADQEPIYARLRDYRVWRLMNSAGRQFIHYGGSEEPTRENGHADVNVDYGGQLRKFSMLLLRATALDPIGVALNLWGEPRRTQWERVRYQFERLAEVAGMEGIHFRVCKLSHPTPGSCLQKEW